MTESSPTVTVSPSFQKPTLENGREKRLSAVPGSVGTLLPNTEAMIVDPSTGKSLGVNQRGELWIRGPQVMKGGLFSVSDWEAPKVTNKLFKVTLTTRRPHQQQ